MVRKDYGPGKGDEKNFISAELQGFAYRMTRTKHGSNWFGPCEVCGGYVNTTYLLTQSRRCKRPDGSFGMTYHKCFQKFGHKDCLTKLTEQQND